MPARKEREKGELCRARERERERSVTPVFAIKTAALREKEGGFGGKADSEAGEESRKG